MKIKDKKIEIPHKNLIDLILWFRKFMLYLQKSISEIAEI